MARTEAYSRDEVIETVYKNRGKTTLVARALGCTPETVRNYAKKYATVASAIETARLDFRDGLADKAEIKLEQAVDEGESWAIQYALKTQARDRGYTEKQEIEHAISGSIEIREVIVEIPDASVED